MYLCGYPLIFLLYKPFPFSKYINLSQYLYILERLFSYLNLPVIVSHIDSFCFTAPMLMSCLTSYINLCSYLYIGRKNGYINLLAKVYKGR